MACILIADDDPSTLDMLDFGLSLDGHEVLRAIDGAQAVALARREAPRLIVMDWMMPVMNGIIAARTLRDDPGTSGIPVVLLTARGTDADLLRAYESGVAAYLTKPVDLDALQAEMSRFLASRPEEQVGQRGAP